MGFRFWLGIEVKGFRVLMLRGLRFSDLVCYAAGGLGARVQALRVVSYWL